MKNEVIFVTKWWETKGIVKKEATCFGHSGAYVKSMSSSVEEYIPNGEWFHKMEEAQRSVAKLAAKRKKIYERKLKALQPWLAENFKGPGEDNKRASNLQTDSAALKDRHNRLVRDIARLLAKDHMADTWEHGGQMSKSLSTNAMIKSALTTVNYITSAVRNALREIGDVDDMLVEEYLVSKGFIPTISATHRSEPTEQHEYAELGE